MIRSQRYFSFASWQIRRLSSSSPVTAIVRSARLMPARSRTHSSVASPYWMACSSSCSTVRYRERSLSITVTSWRLAISSRARFQPTLPAPAITTYMRCLHLFQGALEHLDRVARRADRVEALLRVPLRPRRVHDAADHARHLVVLAGDLRDRQVRVVAVGRGDEDVGLLDAGLAQGVDLEPVAEREAAARVLPGRVHPGVQALMRERILVEHGDVVALGEHRPGDCGPDPAGTHDQDQRHRGRTLDDWVSSPSRAPVSRQGRAGAEAGRPSPSAGARSVSGSFALRDSLAGGAVRMTWHGA